MPPLFRRGNTRFDADDVTDPQRLLRGLNEFALDVAGRTDEIQALTRVAVLPDIIIDLGPTYAVGSAPFPIQVKTPFSVSGAWVIFCDDIDRGVDGVGTVSVGVWSRPTVGGEDGGAAGLEVLFVSGLGKNRKYRVRLAVAGVKNG